MFRSVFRRDKKAQTSLFPNVWMPMKSYEVNVNDENMMDFQNKPFKQARHAEREIRQQQQNRQALGVKTNRTDSENQLMVTAEKKELSETSKLPAINSSPPKSDSMENWYRPYLTESPTPRRRRGRSDSPASGARTRRTSRSSNQTSEATGRRRFRSRVDSKNRKVEAVVEMVNDNSDSNSKYLVMEFFIRRMDGSNEVVSQANRDVRACDQRHPDTSVAYSDVRAYIRDNDLLGRSKVQRIWIWIADVVNNYNYDRNIQWFNTEDDPNGKLSQKSKLESEI